MPIPILFSWPTILNEWFGLYSSNTRCLNASGLKRLHSSTSESKDEGVAKMWREEDRKASSCLFGLGVRRIRIRPATTFTRCAAARLRFASSSGLAAGRNEMHGVTTPATPGKDRVANRGTFRHSAPSPDPRQRLKSSSPLPFHADAPIYNPVAKLGFQQCP